MSETYIEYNVELTWRNGHGSRTAELTVNARTAPTAIRKAQRITAAERGRGATVEAASATLR